MGFFQRVALAIAGVELPHAAAPDGGVTISTPQELDAYLRAGAETGSGIGVTPETSLRVAAVFACVRLISGAVATMPLHIKRRVDDQTREDASDSELWKIIRRHPNRWQKPAQFRRMMQTHVLLRGNGYALKVRTGSRLVALHPLDASRMTVTQADDLSLDYAYTRRNGSVVHFKQDEILHLFSLSLDGIVGVTPLTYARESVGLSLATERHGAATFRNGARVAGVLKHPKKLGNEGRENLRQSLDEYRSGGQNEGRHLILEEGLDYAQIAMTSEDAQWIESRKFSRSDIAMFFGVPPHMIGDVEKSTSWGSGIVEQTNGFIAFGLEEHLTMWEEAVTADLNSDPEIYARFNRAALVKGDLKSRQEYYKAALQWGWMNPDEIRALEDMNPRPDGEGGVYYDPPNTAGEPSSERTSDEPAHTA